MSSISNIRTSILALTAAVLLAGVSAQSAFAMGSAANDPWINHEGSTEAATERSDGFTYIGGRVGHIASPGNRDGERAAAELADLDDRFLGGRAGRLHSGKTTTVN